MSEDFQYVDLSRMFEYPKCAIQVGTEEEADYFLQSAKSQFPERTGGWRSSSNFGTHGDKTCYTLFYEGATEPTNLSYSYKEWFLANGYEIVQFSELVGGMSEIEESDSPLSVLLGCVE